MKLSYFQLEQALTKQLAPVYIVSGDDPWLKQEAIALIRKAAKQAGLNERIRFLPEANTDWEQLYNLLYSISLLAEKRLIELDCRVSLPNKAAATILQEYSNQPAPDHVLLIDMGKVDDKIAKSAWYKALEKIGVAIPIWPIPREQLPKWIIQRANKYKLTFTPAATNTLADYLEGNVAAIAQAIEKIYLFKPTLPIDVDTIETILTHDSRFTIFDWIDALLMGDKARILHILDSLKDDGTEPILLIWGITRELRLLIELIKAHQQGSSLDQLFQKHRIFSRRQTGMRRFISSFSIQDGWHLLNQAAQLDQMLKGSKPGNIWDNLQLFCLRMV